MKLKNKSLRLGQASWVPIAFSIFLLCGIPEAKAQTPQQIAKKALASTVLLVMEEANGKPLGLGSGFFVDTNLIVTNFHVIDGAARGTAKLVGQETKYNIEAAITTDENHDLAILQVSVPGVQPLPLGDSDTVEVGDTVYVAGNPKGYFEGTFSDGIISAVRGDSTNKRIQMTAPISPGSSGGAVLNGGGEVIGVSFATFHDGQNLNFAIPANYLNGLVTCAQGIAKFNQGQHAASMVEFDTAIRLNPDYADPYMWRGIAKYELEERAAIADFDTVIRLRVQRQLQNRKTTRGNHLGQDVTIINHLDSAIRLNPNNASIYMWRGIVRNDLGQHVAAITDLDTAIRLNPNFVFAYMWRGYARARLRQYDVAIADYDVAIRLNPDYAIAYGGRAWIKTELGQYEDAIADYNIAINLEPDSAWPYCNRGWTKGQLGQYAAAIADYNIAINLEPDSAWPYCNRGWTKGQLGQYAAAIADFDIAINLEPNSAEAYHNRGWAKYMLRQYAAAITDCDTAIRLNPDYADAYNGRGTVKANLGQYSAAITDFDTAIRLNPDDANAYYFRGLARYNLGHPWEAKRDFQTALALAKRTGDKRLKIQVESTIRDLR